MLIYVSGDLVFEVRVTSINSRIEDPDLDLARVVETIQVPRFLPIDFAEIPHCVRRWRRRGASLPADG
ncbi:hypothetical protein EME01_28550 [Sinorhizobium meliloti]|nr:hypothetical protein EME01_28550 [Sinorhizobium meliloti]